MPGYSYVAIDKKGKEKKGSMEAESREKVTDALKADGLIPVSITEQGALNRDLNISFGKKSKTEGSQCIFPPVCQHHAGRRADEGSPRDAG